MALHWKNSRTALLSATAMAGALALMSQPAAAQDARHFEFNIPAQPLSSALRAYGIAADEQLVFANADLGGRTAPPLKGSYTAEEALNTLLAGTSLYVHRRESGVLQISAASDPQSGSAAGDGADSGTVQALVVTAQKREENIQDVPIAMSAFTQEDLTRSQVAGGPDLMTQIPNFTFTKTNFTGYSIQIRGIGTQAISATTDAAVAVAFNNTSFIRNRFFEQEFYDLERVEVLRGPQGTLYGRNATAGVVNIISAKPTFHFDSKASIDLGNYGSHRIEGMLNLPIVPDKVALRIAGAWTKRDGYDTNQLTGQSIDGRDLWSTRVSLRVDPSDKIHTNLIWEHFQENDDRLRSGKQLCKKDLKTEIGGAPLPDIVGLGIGDPASTYSQGCAPVSLYSNDAFQTPNGYSLPYYLPLGELGLPAVAGLDPYLNATQSRNLRVIESSFEPKYRAKSDLGELQVTFDISSNLAITSETAYSTDFVWSVEDYNRFTTTPHAFNKDYHFAFREGVLSPDGVFCDPQVGCSDRLTAADLSTAKSRQFSQEFRLSSTFEGPFNFNLGVNFLRYDTEDKYYVFINTLTATAASENTLTSAEPAWVPGVTDNHDCLRYFKQGDPTHIQQLTTGNCWYIDPNPIESVNDEGHNYFLSRNPYKLISYAVFGEGYYQITPNLKLTAGLRWTVDKKEAPEIPSWLLAPRTVGYPVLDVVRQEWREPTGRLALDWRPNLGFTDETLLYASYARGYKAGGANPPPATIVTYGDNGVGALLHASLTHPKTFGPEFINAFEVGSKNTLAGGKLILNGDVFYYDYTGYQISEIVDRAAINHNYDAKVWGAELEADWRPLENLKLGVKAGYEKTRVANGMKAIDLMDRTGGHTDWIVARPFPTVPSSCIIPVYVAAWGGEVHVPPGRTTPNVGPCAEAYQQGFDPVTNLPYVPNPTVYNESDCTGCVNLAPLEPQWAGYPGFNPASAPNNGEGFAKDLGGNDLPNAPHFTTTVTVDYTLPLRNDWMLTLHTDLYRQSAAWARIFNDNPYDRIKPYTNVNFAAIFSNEDAGWTVMAYVKNVFDKTNITGAFLNSDDTGLTTNVFLNEPRLYGLKVTKQWSDLPWHLGSRPAGQPYPLTVELGGSVLRQAAHNDPVTDDALAAFPPALLPANIQDQKLDWGDGREIQVAYAPAGGSWRIQAGARFGRANADNKALHSQQEPKVCGFPFDVGCDNPAFEGFKYARPINSSRTQVSDQDKYLIADFKVGREVGLGMFGGDGSSSLALGLSYAKLTSKTTLAIQGTPDWNVPEGWYFAPTTTHHWYDGSVTADREFEGAGPVLSWDASRRLLGNDENGRVNLAWAMGGGVLFGKQSVDVGGDVLSNSYMGRYVFGFPPTLLDSRHIPIDRHRSKSATVPAVNLSLGLAYEVDRFKVSGGYRWERYFNAIDGGDRERRTFDRTFDGPYFKIAVGFGG